MFVQDVRGRFRSEGDFVPFLNEAVDGYAWQRDSNRGGLGAPEQCPIDVDEWRRIGITRSLTTTGILFGTPQQAARAIIERTEDIPVDQIHIWGTIANLDEKLSERNVELAFTQLAPLLRIPPEAAA